MRNLSRVSALWTRSLDVSPLASRRFSSVLTADALQGEEEDGKRLRLAFAASCIPHPQKRHRGGEDSYFACPLSRSFGVADGVGGWADAGVDPGEFARCLLRFAYESIRRSDHEAPADLSEAFQNSQKRLSEEGVQGGSTVLLGQLNGSTVGILNLGDSGVMLLRPALRTPPSSDQPLLFPRVIFRSSDQTHHFNCPYQLGSGSALVEAPDYIRIRVRAGDIVVAATDGVFDNLFEHQVQSIVARHLSNAWRSNQGAVDNLPDLARSIVEQAHRVGQHEDRKDIITPFALSAHSEGLTFRGGKLDDTTAVVGLVCVDAAPGDPQNTSPHIHNFNE